MAGVFNSGLNLSLALMYKFYIFFVCQKNSLVALVNRFLKLGASMFLNVVTELHKFITAVFYHEVCDSN